MKRYEYSITKLLLGSLMVVLSSCSQDETPRSEPTGEPVAVQFDLSNTLTRADGAATSEIMKAGNTLQVFAFNQGSDVTTTPLAIETYTVSADGKATGNMKLFRGEYDLYFSSYNAAGQPPQLDASGGTVTSENGKDFMCSLMKGVAVQPDGNKPELTLSLITPFTRMGTQITAEIKASQTQPVPISKMKVNYITVKNLSTPLSWKLGTTAWSTTGQIFDQEQSFTEFIGNELEYFKGYKSTPKVLLPTDGSTQLEFLINMTVNDKVRNYKATLQKPLLQGMAYNFIFTLTFYGDILLSDLTLAIKEYNNVTLNTDLIGGDK